MIDWYRGKERKSEIRNEGGTNNQQCSDKFEKMETDTETCVRLETYKYVRQKVALRKRKEIGRFYVNFRTVRIAKYYKCTGTWCIFWLREKGK